MKQELNAKRKDAKLWDRQPDDWYVEPQWVSSRLFDVEPFGGEIWDPACGGGNIITAALCAGLKAHGSDKVRRYPGAIVLDFLAQGEWPDRVDNIVSNPPFKHAQRFVEIALSITDGKVAMMLPAAWVQGDKRSRWLETTPLARIYFLAPRPSMPPGEVIAAGVKAGNGTTDYAWFIWDHAKDPESTPEIKWLRRQA